MPIQGDCNELPVDQPSVARLWHETCRARNFPDETVVVRCVSSKEMARLNANYRHKNTPTNVLSFSYDQEAWPNPPEVEAEKPAQHEVVVCLAVAQQEAEARSVAVASYVALLLVHGFLHLTGLDHEKSESAARATHKQEAAILRATGFVPLELT